MIDIETRARRLGNKFWGRFIGSRSMEKFRREVANTIREAVEEEREACAALVQKMGNQYTELNIWTVMTDGERIHIPSAIRARREKS